MPIQKSHMGCPVQKMVSERARCKILNLNATKTLGKKCQKKRNKKELQSIENNGQLVFIMKKIAFQTHLIDFTNTGGIESLASICLS